MALSKSHELPLGMMAFWANIDLQEHAAYQRWHNAEHIPERLSIAGFQRGARYRSVKDDTRFLMFYETTGAEVLASQCYLSALNNPTTRTKRALTWFQNPVRNVYRLLATKGDGPVVPAPILITLKFARHQDVMGDLQIGDLADFLVRRVAIYEIEPTGSSVRTSESSLHGAKSASTGGLVRIESDDLRLLDEPGVWSDLRAALVTFCANLGIEIVEEIDIGSIEYCQDSEIEEMA